MDKENRFLAAAIIMAGYCANSKFANFTGYSLAEMAVEAEHELEKAMGCGEKAKKVENESK